MPRHPPCALEQQTHTRITQHTNKTHTNKKQDARVHYTVLTHHTHHHQPAQTANQHEVSHNQEQPPTHHMNNVMQPAGTMCCPRHPTVHQQSTHIAQQKRFMNNHPHHTKPQPLTGFRVRVHLDISNTAGSTTLGYSTNKKGLQL